MMLMQVTCPHCGARYQFERSLIPQAGYDAQCANCSGIFVVAPDARESQPPIALPSMSMVDTWLAPPAQAPKSARPAATVGELPVVKTPAQSAPRPAAAASPTPGAQAALQFTISCPSCESVYAFAANDVPMGGVDAPCGNCGAVYHLPRVGDPSAAFETLRPLQPTVLEQPKDGDIDIGAALAPDLHGDKGSTPDGEMIRGMSEPGFIDAALREQSFASVRDDGPKLGDFASARVVHEPFVAEDAEIVAEVSDLPVPKASAAKSPDEVVVLKNAKADDLAAEPSISESMNVEITLTGARKRGGGAFEPAAAPLPSLGADEPVAGDMRDLDAIADKRPELGRAIVPMAVSERSRAGKTNWGGAPVGDPQAVMRSRVRRVEDSKSRVGDSRERGKSRRPPFDDDDVARMRNRGGIIGDPTEFDDFEEKELRKNIVMRNIALAFFGMLALIALAIFAVVPALTGKTAVQILHIGTADDPRLAPLLAEARAALWPDTDVKYREAAKAASDALDIDPANSEGRTLYGLAAVFRGVDMRTAAQDLAAQGEVVQSSQMLATASAELAHARRVLTHKNDETAELLFAAGIYYALDEDQRSSAREAFRRGMELSRAAESAPTPTPFAAYLDAMLRNLEGDKGGARAALERAMKLEPRWQRPRFELGRMDAANGENAAARAMLQDVLSRDAEHAKAKALLAVVPESTPVPHVTQTAAVPTRAEPTQVLPSAMPESLKESEQRVETNQVKGAPPGGLPPPALHPPQQTPPPASPRAEPRSESQRDDVQKRLEALKQELPPEPKNEPAPHSSETQTPPDAPNIVRGTPPPFNPDDKAPPPSDKPRPPSDHSTPPGDKAAPPSDKPAPPKSEQSPSEITKDSGGETPAN